MSAAGWDFASADNSNTLINSTSFVTILSKTIAAIAAHDTLLLDVWGTFLNNSGGARQYSAQILVGATAVLSSVLFNVGASTTSRTATALRFIVSISATNIWRAEGLGWTAGVIPSGGNSTLAGAYGTWKSGADNLTGTKAVTFQIKSNSAIASQTFTMHSYGVRRIPQVP